MAQFSELFGQVLERVDVSDEVIDIYTSSGHYQLYHAQNCCESVYVEDVSGDLEAMRNALIVDAREDSNSTDPPPGNGCNESWTWTFYNLTTLKGSATFRWFGSSNGYYSERVSFAKVGEHDKEP